MIFISRKGKDMSKIKGREQAVVVFQRAILRIRDILRSPGVSITGMESMQHICIYLLTRYMTRERARSLELPYCWEDLMEGLDTREGQMQFALDFLYHPTEDCLVRHFDRLFGTHKLAFEIRHLGKHREILELLDPVQLEKVDIDILGWVYEQHLQKGSTGGGQRDLGQFFTDRVLCRYMTRLCAPRPQETVWDPTMGTGGFLTSYVDYFREQGVEMDWATRQAQIHGCDTDPRVAGIAAINLFLEMDGILGVNLRLHDSLYQEKQDLSGVDLILANMPFGLKGIAYKECCERIRRLGIQGNRSEPLFLQLMMATLNMGGRCAVVVPDGMLANSHTIYRETRRHLLDHFELRRVIKMKGRFFMNSGIEPSILFFERTGRATGRIEFWELDKESGERFLFSTDRAQLGADHSLNPIFYRPIPADLAPRFPTIRLGDWIVILGGRRRSIREANPDGAFPFVTCSILGTSRIDVADFDHEAIIINAVNGSGRCRPYLFDRYSTTCHNIHFHVRDNQDDLLLRYLWLYLLWRPTLLEAGFAGSHQKKIHPRYIQNIHIPLPPRLLQEKIIRALDHDGDRGRSTEWLHKMLDSMGMRDRLMDRLLSEEDRVEERLLEARGLLDRSIDLLAAIAE